MDPRYPLYIVSKGRWDTRKTSKVLHHMNLPHYIVVEDQEHDAYAAVVDETATLLVLDPRYQEEYELCDDLGLTKSPGPGPARNFVWDHSINAGASSHWVMDDNIRGFYNFNRNQFSEHRDGSIFYWMEEFVSRYSNIAMVGPDYEMFVPRRNKTRPFILNTRIYSCNLIRNDTPYRWRGRYNEDTDLSLRMLKDRWCTVLFRAFLQGKIATQRVKGGNTKEFYEKEGTGPKSEMLVKLHPDVARLVQRWNRVHHVVDYKRFKHGLRRKEETRAGR